MTIFGKRQDKASKETFFPTRVPKSGILVSSTSSKMSPIAFYFLVFCLKLKGF
jgi:hypothetical protein